MRTIAEYTRLLEAETKKIIVGKRRQIDLILMTIFSGGHVLLNDLPGSGKTTLVKTLSLALGCDFKRLQFTPDLLPSDIVGMTVFNQKKADFQLVKGPVHTHILLADEINRAIPRTQPAGVPVPVPGKQGLCGHGGPGVRDSRRYPGHLEPGDGPPAGTDRRSQVPEEDGRGDSGGNA